MLDWIMELLQDYRIISTKLLGGVIQDHLFGDCAIVQLVTRVERSTGKPLGRILLPPEVKLQLKFTLQADKHSFTPIHLRITEGDAELTWRFDPDSPRVPHALQWLTDSAIAHLAIELVKKHPRSS